jgi:putative transposase
MVRRYYESDLTDAEWELLSPLLLRKKRRGPRSIVDLRSVMNGIFYLLRTGCQWRMLPREYEPWTVVQGYFRRWTNSNKWEEINKLLRSKLRKSAGKEESPSVAIIDSQSVKTVQKGGLEAMMLVRKLREESGI